MNEAEAGVERGTRATGKGPHVSPTPRSLRACLRSTVNSEKLTTVRQAIMDFTLFTHYTNIFFSLKNPDILFQKVNFELSRLISWFQANRLSINNSQENEKSDN